MKEMDIRIPVRVCQYEELTKQERVLIDLAKATTQKSYSPYSRFAVGAAALLADGTIVTGSNQENAAFPSSTCAERTTLFYANSQHPDTPVTALAIAAQTGGNFTDAPITPCGACRQVILGTETRFGQTMRILLYGSKEIYIIDGARSLLPLSFDGSEME